MFERYTGRARRVVVLASDEARGFHRPYVGTEHLLLGLIGEAEGVAAKALAGFGLTVETVRAKVEEIDGRGDAAGAGHIPFTVRAKKVIELSLREALQLGHNFIGTEHILLAVVREGEGVGARALVGLDVDLADIRKEVVRLLTSYTKPAPPLEPVNVISLTPAASTQLAAWLSRVEATFGPFAEDHPARQLRLAIIDAERKRKVAS